MFKYVCLFVIFFIVLVICGVIEDYIKIKYLDNYERSKFYERKKI